MVFSILGATTERSHYGRSERAGRDCQRGSEKEQVMALKSIIDARHYRQIYPSSPRVWSSAAPSLRRKDTRARRVHNEKTAQITLYCFPAITSCSCCTPLVPPRQSIFCGRRSQRTLFSIGTWYCYDSVAYIDWVAGYSYIICDPLAYGRSTFMFESVPT